MNKLTTVCVFLFALTHSRYCLAQNEWKPVPNATDFHNREVDDSLILDWLRQSREEETKQENSPHNPSKSKTSYNQRLKKLYADQYGDLIKRCNYQLDNLQKCCLVITVGEGIKPIVISSIARDYIEAGWSVKLAALKEPTECWMISIEPGRIKSND